MSSKKNKLILLQNFLNLEIGRVKEQSFDYENSLYTKSVEKKGLDRVIKNCHLCRGLNIERFTNNCPGWGDLNAKILFVGQSLHLPGILSDIPFILGSGYILDAALRLSGLLRKDVFITNALHCHPPNNRASTEKERQNCLSYLVEEILIVRPILVVALGNDAQQSVFAAVNKPSIKGLNPPIKVKNFKHPAAFSYSAPEERIDWIIRLSNEIDKVYK